MSKKSDAAVKDTKDTANIPHKEMLKQIMALVDDVLNKSKYNKVDLTKIFSFMNIY